MGLAYTIKEFLSEVSDKKIAVLGMGVNHQALLQYLAAHALDVTVFDKKEEKDLKSQIEQLSGTTVKFCLGEHYLKGLLGYDLIFRTPGMRFDLPEISMALENGAKLTSEMEIFFDVCPAKIIAVTGSDGKTTTTTLIYQMLKESGYQVFLGGNIGKPLLHRVEEMKATDKVVVELSSFQLHTMRKSPQVAVITNISPNHLDVHKSMEEYVEAKKQIFLHQKKGDRLVLNYDDALLRTFANESEAKVVFFSRKSPIEEGVFLTDQQMVSTLSEEHHLLNVEDIFIPGVHNIENFMAAISAVSGDVDDGTIASVAKTFGGVEHRIEFVREKDGVRYYNDSIASSPTRTIAGLRSFQKRVILIAGGYDKKIPYDELGEEILKHVHKLYLIGQTGPKIEQSVLVALEQNRESNGFSYEYATDLKEAVEKAGLYAQKGDVVLLSPASASFDMFKNFEDRGNQFKYFVHELKD
jgi:UDP-N-acetylmuramoylalanine--D-glutamate ligase